MLSALLPAWPLGLKAQPTPDLLMQAVWVRLGVERVVKLELERRVLALPRSLTEAAKERQRLARALDALAQPQKALSGRREAQVQRAVGDASELLGQVAAAAAPAALVGQSEALAARLGQVMATLAGLASDGERAAQVDLLARAAAFALRLGKLNFAAAAAGGASADVAVSAQQTLGEFRAALQAVGAQRLDERAQQDLQLAQNQWLLLSNALGPSGLAKSSERLAEVATTTDRIAESMGALARRS
jgi:hypothetical protein